MINSRLVSRIPIHQYFSVSYTMKSNMYFHFPLRVLTLLNNTYSAISPSTGFAQPTATEDDNNDDDDDDVVVLSEHLDDSQKPLFEKMINAMKIQKIKKESQEEFDTEILEPRDANDDLFEQLIGLDEEEEEETAAAAGAAFLVVLLLTYYSITCFMANCSFE